MINFSNLKDPLKGIRDLFKHKKDVVDKEENEPTTYYNPENKYRGVSTYYSGNIQNDKKAVKYPYMARVNYYYGVYDTDSDNIQKEVYLMSKDEKDEKDSLLNYNVEEVDDTCECGCDTDNYSGE